MNKFNNEFNVFLAGLFALISLFLTVMYKVLNYYFPDYNYATALIIIFFVLIGYYIVFYKYFKKNYKK